MKILKRIIVSYQREILISKIKVLININIKILQTRTQSKYKYLKIQRNKPGKILTGLTFSYWVLLVRVKKAYLV